MTDYKPIIVLDDDPTGTQTVHGVPVLTEWTKELIQQEFEAKTPVFFILTNSRSLIAEKANQLAFEIGQNIRDAAFVSHCDFYIVSRGDSTLRGHFPNEIEALMSAFPSVQRGRGYIIALIPAFFEGNRFTKNDIHYLVENDNWIPVGETPYAQDATFGYKNSDLKLWIEEKTQGKIKVSKVTSFDPNTEGVDFMEKKLNQLNCHNENKVLIVNALNYNDLEKFALVALRSNQPILYRTSASFIKAFAGIESKPLLTRLDLIQDNAEKIGGLIVVGSHVPKTTAQLTELLKTDIVPFEINIKVLFGFGPKWFEYLTPFIYKICEALKEGKNVVLYTSRDVVLGVDENESLKKSLKVSDNICWIIKQLFVKPAFLIAKGGITSSDIATKSLKVKRAIAIGQIEVGIPVWQLGEEAKFPNMPYIIFPGNVGTDDSLKNIYEKLK